MMDLESMCNDRVCLLKINGKKYENTPALVQSEMILVSDTSIPIEEGDQLTRDLPNGIREVFDVIDPIYFGDNVGVEPHYQVQVKKVPKCKENQKNKGVSGIQLLSRVIIQESV